LPQKQGIDAFSSCYAGLLIKQTHEMRPPTSSGEGEPLTTFHALFLKHHPHFRGGAFSMARRKKAVTVQKTLLSVAEVAVMLGVCRTTVYKYIYSEGLPSMLLRGAGLPRMRFHDLRHSAASSTRRVQLFRR
jgi:hypothetical protein